MSALPLAYHLSKTEEVKFVVAKEFGSILEGVGYVQPRVWDVAYNEIPRAIERIGKEGVICQSHAHPDKQRLTESYQKESWRVAGYLEEFGKHPLIFDRRDKNREFRLIKEIFGKMPLDKPLILFNGKSHSSPIDSRPILEAIVQKYYGTHWILNCSDTKADRIYDMLRLIENAAVLVSVDTMSLHLARATSTPVVALINNGWLGSIPPPSTKATIRYADVTPSKVMEALEGIL